MPSRRQRRAMRKLFEKAYVVAFDTYLLVKVMCIYKILMTKNFFMTIPNFEEFNRMGPTLAGVVKEVIKNVAEEILGPPFSDQNCEELAARGWLTLRAEYQSEQ